MKIFSKPDWLAASLLFGISLFAAQVASQTGSSGQSLLWGQSGEEWDTSELPDFTNVGYKGGNAPIPHWPVGVNVKDFGAVGDGVHDDTAAINRAIAQSPPGTAVLIPNGTYVIKDYLRIERDHVVLRGQDMDKTILYFPLGLRDIYGLEDEDGNEIRWQFDGGFITYYGGTQRSLENFTIKFPEIQFEGHFSTKGTNAIEIGGVEDSWIRSLRIINANAGISLRGRRTRNITILDIEFDNYSGRQNGRSVGHSGIKVKDAEYNLIHNVAFNGGPYEHELNTNGAKNNVFSRFSGSNMQMDWHGGTIRNNLWTEFDLGEGKPGTTGRPTFRSGGTNEVLWNINSERNQYYYDVYRISKSGEKYQGADKNDSNIVVGLKTELPTDITDDYWHEKIEPDLMHPQNLYLAQLERLQKSLPQSFQAQVEDELCFPVVPSNRKTAVVCF